MWAQEESRQLRELKERLGYPLWTARLDGDLECFGRGGSQDGVVAGSEDGRSTRKNGEAFPVGSRIRVLRGKRFHEFGSGDAGVVIRSDEEAGVCTVAFDRSAEPLQVAVRHLELDPRYAHQDGENVAEVDRVMQLPVAATIESASNISGAEVWRSESRERSPRRPSLEPASQQTFENPAGVIAAGADCCLFAGESPRWRQESELGNSSNATVLERARWRVADSGTGSSGRRSASMPPQFGAPSQSYSSSAPAEPCSDVLWDRVASKLVTDQPLDTDVFRSQQVNMSHPSISQDSLREETAELRRAADAAAAAEYRRAADFVSDRGTNQLRLDVSESIAAAAAGAAREEAEALAEAVQASATATATATATAMNEVAALRLALAEVQSLVRSEAEQRANSFFNVSRDIEQIRAQHKHHYMETEDSLKAEQKRLARKQAELVSLCLSLQKEQHERAQPSSQVNAAWEAHEASILSVDEQVKAVELAGIQTAERVALAEQRIEEVVENQQRSRLQVSALDARLSDLDQLQTTMIETERDIRLASERLDTMSARVDALAANLARKADRESPPAAAGRIDALASRIDSLVMDISAKAEREPHAGEVVIDALTIRVDRLAETLASEVVRLEALHSKSLQETATSLEQRESEQLRRLSAEADRHAAELREVATGIEAKATEAIKIGQRAREALEAHCEIASDKNNAIDVMRSRVEALGEGLSMEARLREEAHSRLEAQCRQAQQDATSAAAKFASTSPETDACTEHELRVMIGEVRMDANRADHERREEIRLRQESELALQRMRGEIDVLREELTRRKSSSFPSSPTLAASGVTSNMRNDPRPSSPKIQIDAVGSRYSHFPPAPAQERRQSHGSFQSNSGALETDFFRWDAQRHPHLPSPPELSTVKPPPRSGSMTPPPMISEPLARWASTPALPVANMTAIGTPPLPARGSFGRGSAPSVPGQTPALMPLPAVPSCCGIALMPDSQYCRKCGKRRSDDPNGIAAFPRSSLANGTPVNLQMTTSTSLGGASTFSIPSSAMLMNGFPREDSRMTGHKLYNEAMS